MTSGKTISKNIKKLRAKLGLTQDDLAKKAEIKSKQFFHLAEVRLAEYQKMIEKDKTEIARNTLEKYEQQLNHALEKTEEAKEKGKDVEKLKEVISEKIIKHLEV